MAFLPNQQDQTQQSQQQQQNQIPAVPQIPTLQGTSGPNGGSGSGTGSTNTASPGGAPSLPWQNITTYLQANAGQAGNVADTIAGNLQNQYNSANQAIGQTQQNFGQQIEGARNPLNQDVVNRATASPSQFVQNPNDVSAFQKMFGGQYAGPQNFSGSQDYSTLQSQIQNGQKQAALVNQGTEGLMTLLQEAESSNGQNPTRGITSLDALLLQEDPANFSKLSAAQAPFAGLTNYLSSTQQGLDTQAQKAAQEAAATGSTLQNQFMGPSGIVPTMQQSLNDKLQAASKQAQTYNTSIADIVGKLNSGQPLTQREAYAIDPSGTLQTLNPYGTSTGIFPNMLAEGLPGVGPGMLAQFYDQPAQIAQPGLGNVMSPEEFANAQAINQLVGQDAVNVPAQLGNQFSVPDSMGAFRGQDALQALYNTLNSDQSMLPQMSTDQSSSWLNDMQALASYLGLPSPYTGPGIQPLSNPVDTTAPYTAPTTPVTSTDTKHVAY